MNDKLKLVSVKESYTNTNSTNLLELGYGPTKNFNNIQLEEKDFFNNILEKEGFLIDNKNRKYHFRVKNLNSLLLQTGTKSDPLLVKSLCEEIQEEIDNGNNEALYFLEALIKTKKEYPDLHFELMNTISVNGRSYYQKSSKTIFILKDLLSAADSCIFHEIGHMLHNLNTHNEIPKNIKDLINDSKNNSLKNKYGEFIDYFINKSSDLYNLAFTDYCKEKGINYNLNDSDISNYYTDQYKKLNFSNNDSNKLANHNILSEINSIYESYHLSSGLSAMQDFLDAVFEGELMGVRSNSLGAEVAINGHGRGYYQRDKGFQFEFNELIANYTDLRVNGHTEKLDYIKYLVGDELYNEVEKIYEKSLNTPVTNKTYIHNDN